MSRRPRSLHSRVEHSDFLRPSSFACHAVAFAKAGALSFCHFPLETFARQPLGKARRAHERITNFLLAIPGPMFILGKNCGAFANGNLSGALPEENPEQTPA